MELVFPRLKKWQADVYNDVASSRGNGRIYVVKSKRQVGKTALAIILMIKFAVEKKSTICLVEPVLSQSRRVFKQINNILEKTNLIKSANAQTLDLVLSNGSEILFRSAEQKDTLRGMTLDFLVIDEGSFILDEVYEVLFPTVDAKRAPILLISTPLFEDGKFYELYNSPSTSSYDWSMYDTSEFLSAEKLEYYRQTLSPNKFKSEYLGEFISDGSFVFGDVRKCIRESYYPPIYCGIDWANGDNGDYTVTVFFDEFGNQTLIKSSNNLSPTEQIEWIAELLNNTPTLKKIQVELNSIGTVYYDFLKKALKRKDILFGFDTTNESKRRIIERLVTAFNKGEIGILDDKELIKELQHYAVEKTSKGYTYNGIGANDDYVMATAIGYDCISSNSGEYVLSFGKKKNQKKSLREKYG